MLLDPIINAWLKLNRRQIAVAEREAPLRNELYTRILIFAVALLALQFGLLWWAGIRERDHAPFGFSFLTGFPAGFLLITALARKRLPPLAFAGVFGAIAIILTLPVAPTAVPNPAYEYPQYGGALVLTILLSGHLVGKSYVRLWTITCVILQFAAPASSWRVNALWGWCT